MKTLISKLNDPSRIAATRAAGICVGLEPFLLALLEQPGSDFVILVRQSGISLDMPETDLQAEVRP